MQQHLLRGSISSKEWARSKSDFQRQFVVAGPTAADLAAAAEFCRSSAWSLSCPPLSPLAAGATVFSLGGCWCLRLRRIAISHDGNGCKAWF